SDSVDFGLIPRKLTLTGGTRYSRTDTSEAGSSVGGFGCRLTSGAPNPCLNHSNFINLNAEGLDRTFSGFRSRANLSWKVTEDALLYYTWSQGFRAGGFNRAPSPPSGNSPLGEGTTPWQAPAVAHGNLTTLRYFAPA